MKLKDLPEYCIEHKCQECEYTVVCHAYFRDCCPFEFRKYVRDIENDMRKDEEK